MTYATITIEGGLFPPDLLDRIASGDGNVGGQRTADFALPRGRSLPDEIQRAFSDARVHWDAFSRRLERSRESRTTLTRQDWCPKLFELLDFPPLEYQRAAIDAGGASFPISHRSHDAENAPPIHIVAIDQDLDQRGTGNRRTPHALVQDFLNRSEALWGVVTNGAKLRLLRNSARLSKPTYLEFDIQAMVDGNAYSEFVVLYRLLHATRFPRNGVEPHGCLLEDYYNQGIEQGGRVREKLRDGVKNALEILGTALVSHSDNEPLRAALSNRRPDETGYYRQLLNLVYRLLFLMVTEERRLLSEEAGGRLHAVYERYYSVTGLRYRAERYFAGDAHGDLWAGLSQTFRLFRDENAAQQLGLSPLNGELFGRSACADIESAFCPNESLLTAMRSLSTFDDNGTRRRVNYAHLDVEEFGSVYESLLDYRPVVHLGSASGAPPLFQLAAGTERKRTRSYYSPPKLVRELIESALVPVLEERLSEAKTPQEKEQTLLDLRVCDPASGSGHFLLAAARRIARELAKVRTGDEEPAPSHYRSAIRDVVRHCIYAVDKNPLAVDLCKVALWIEGHAAGLPLGFLDHHIKCGDSLVGVMDFSVLTEGIPDDAYKAVTGDDKDAARNYRQRNKKEREGQQSMALDTAQAYSKELAGDFAAFAELEERNPSDVHAKEDLYEQLRGSGTRWWETKTACDLWTYAFFSPLRKAGPNGLDRVPTTDNIRNVLQGRSANPQLEGEAIGASQTHRFFHWPLEFPDVFEQGGFDVVLANPPWDPIQPEEVTFFGDHDSKIAALAGATRKTAIEQLIYTDPHLFSMWESQKRSKAGISKFARTSCRFRLTAVGKINTYAVFSETGRSVLHPRGRIGMIVPSGIATDDTTKTFFADLVDKHSLASLYDFENREKVFPGIDSRIKFCLLTMSGADRPTPQAQFAFFLHRVEQIWEDERRFTLTAEDFALFNPNTRNCPIFRTRRDMEIAQKMYRRASVFWQEAKAGLPEANPWGAKLSTMFNMTSDSGLFRTREQLTGTGWKLEGKVFVRGGERYLPLYESKNFHQYDHRFATFDGASAHEILSGNARDMTPEEKTDPEAVVIPRYWVREDEVSKKLDGRELTTQSTDRHSTVWPSWLATRSPGYRSSDRRAHGNSRNDSSSPGWPYGSDSYRWVIAFRNIARATDQRTSISAGLNSMAMDGGGPLIQVDYEKWLQVFRDITNATNERTGLTSNLPHSGVGHSSSMLHYEYSRAVASALVLANMNSIPLDWASRLSVGGTHMSFFIVKQLPVLPPEVYLEEAIPGTKYVALIVPRVLELTYTANDLAGFAEDLGYDGPPFAWDEKRRHRVKCELDAIYSHMYQLDRAEVEWILEPRAPSSSFPGLQRAEMSEFGEYRTQRYILHAYDQLAHGELPNLEATPA